MNFLGTEFSSDIKEVSTKDLAYVGDAIFELYCRIRFSFKNSDVKKHVNAGAQARFFDTMFKELDEEETAVAMRGRNLKTPRSKEPDYRKATAFESVIGYLFLLKREKRLKTLLDGCLDSENS